MSPRIARIGVGSEAVVACHSGAMASAASAVTAAKPRAKTVKGASVTPISTVGITAATDTPRSAPVSRHAARRTWPPSMSAALEMPWA